MSKIEVMLNALEDVRWQMLRELSDIEEEEGDAQTALGWRWMAENKKWPLVNKAGHYRFLFYTDYHKTKSEYSLPLEISQEANCQKVSKSFKKLMKIIATRLGLWLKESKTGSYYAIKERLYKFWISSGKNATANECHNHMEGDIGLAKIRVYLWRWERNQDIPKCAEETENAK